MGNDEFPNIPAELKATLEKQSDEDTALMLGAAAFDWLIEVRVQLELDETANIDDMLKRIRDLQEIEAMWIGLQK